MALSLLDRVKQKAFDALSGAGNFLNQVVQEVPQVAQSAYKAYTNVAPYVPFAPQVPTPQSFQALQSNIVSPINNYIQDRKNYIQQNPPSQLFDFQRGLKDLQGTDYNIKTKLLGFGPNGELPQTDPAQGILYGELGPLFKGTQFLGSKAMAEAPIINDALGQIGKISLGAPAQEGSNALPELLMNYFKKKGSSAANFIADEAGNISKVKEGGKKTAELFKQVQKTVLPSSGEIAGQLPPGKTPLALPAPRISPVVDELRNIQSQVADTVKNMVPSTQEIKGGVKRTAEYLFGNAKIKGARGVAEADSPAAKVAMDIVNSAEQKSADLTGQAQAQLRSTFNGLNDNELATFSDVVEGGLAPISEAQAKAVEVWKSIREDIHNLATQTGMKVGKLNDYFPHFFKKEGKVALDEGSFIDRGANVDYGNLVKSRKGEGDYLKNPEVLFNYIQHAYDNIVKRSYFGEGDKHLYALARKATNPQQVSGTIDKILGKGSVGGIGNEIASKITSLENTKLNLISPLTNLTQQISTIGRTDVPTAIKTYAKMISNPEETILNAIKANEIDPTLGRKFLAKMGELKDASIGSKWLEFIRFNLAEKGNRVFAVNAGMEYAKKLASQAQNGSQAAIRELERLGIKNVAQMTEQDIIRAGRKMSQMTQFTTKPGSLPAAWETPVGRVATQFKGFGYKQTGFLKDEIGRVAKEFANGNPKPLVSALTAYGVGSALMGEILNDARSFVTNKKRDKMNLLQRYLSDVVSGSSLGLLDNTDALLGKYGGSGIISTVAGPFAGDVAKGVDIAAQARKGLDNYDPQKSFAENVDPTNSGRRTLLREIPGIGATLANTFVDNSYIDNVYGGVNKGLDKKDKQTYDQLSQIDPQAAEKFKTENQYADKAQTQEKGSFLNTLFGGKQKPAWDKVPSTKKEKTVYDSMVDTALENGAEVPDNALKERFFKGKDYSKKDFSDRKDILESMVKVQQDQYLTDEQKAKIAQAAGIPPKDLEYYQMARMDGPERLAGVLSFAEGDHPDRQQFIVSLLQNKRKVGGSAVLDNDMVDSLYDRGLISKEEKALVNAVKYDQVYQRFYVDRDYVAKYGKGGTNDQAAAKKLNSKVKAFVTGLNSLHKKIIAVPEKGIKKNRQVVSTKTPQAPKLNLTLTKPRSSAQWFKPY